MLVTVLNFVNKLPYMYRQIDCTVDCKNTDPSKKFCPNHFVSYSEEYLNDPMNSNYEERYYGKQIPFDDRVSIIFLDFAIPIKHNPRSNVSVAYVFSK